MEKRDEELIEDYHQGNHDAVGTLFERYKKPVFNFALRMLANRADAEDVTAEVFLVLFSKKYTRQLEAKFSTWLFTVVRNQCIDKIRKRGRTIGMWFSKGSSDDYEQWDVPDPESSPSADLEQKERAVMVRKAMKKLPINQREVLLLREYQKLSYAEISQILKCSLENVKVLIFRARERLKVELVSISKEGF